MNIIATMKNAVLKKIQGSPGLSQQVDMQTIGNATDDAEVYHPAGFYSKPVDGVVGVVIDAGDNNIVVATHNYNFEKDVDKGEALIYSIDINGNIKASAKVDKDGNFVVNDGTRSAVAFDKLKEGFDALNDKYNDLVAKYNAHIHITTATVGATAVPGVISPTTNTETPSTSSIDDSEVNKVLLP